MIGLMLVACVSLCTDKPGPGPDPDPDPDPIPEEDVAWPTEAGLDCAKDTFGFRDLSGRDDFHPALDICGPGVVPVRAAADGVVSRVVEWDGGSGSGHNVVIHHPQLSEMFDGQVVQTRYNHLEDGSAAFEVGQQVTAGTQIGAMGDTGANSVHLHFSVVVGSDVGDPKVRHYIHPLRLLPYKQGAPPNVVLEQYSPKERGCGDAGIRAVVSHQAPVMDAVGIRLKGADDQITYVPFDSPGIDDPESWVEGDRDDFTQDCIEVSAVNFDFGDPKYTWSLGVAGLTAPVTAFVYLADGTVVSARL